MKKTILLFDADHTLLDFAATEETGLTKCFQAFSLPFTPEVRAWYLNHNKALWDDYEKGIIPRETIFCRRFPETFAHFGFSADGHEMEKAYRQALTEGCDLLQGALDVVKALSKTHRLFIVTNGLASTQHRRLRDSGLDVFFEQIFISEEIGFQKPQKEYFDYCFQAIPHFKKEDALIIGDSLSSDIQGGSNAGIDTCWYNPNKTPNTTSLEPSAEIETLWELFSLLEINEKGMEP